MDGSSPLSSTHYQPKLHGLLDRRRTLCRERQVSVRYTSLVARAREHVAELLKLSRDELVSVPQEERLEALSTLFESLDDEPEEPGWREAWIAEIQRRIEGIRNGSRKTVSWDEARSYVLDRLRAVRG